MRQTKNAFSEIVLGLFVFLCGLGHAFGQMPTTIDVLVIYSGNAKAAAGSQNEIEGIIVQAGIQANTAYSNSSTSQRVRIVKMEEAPFEYVDPGIICTSRDRLQNPNDGYLDYVQNLRNQYGADAVVLVTNDAIPEFGAGCAFVCGLDGVCNSSFEDKAFASVNWSYLGKDVLTHELGHIMGLMHEREASNCPDACLQGAAPDGYGFQDQTFNNCWVTVMYSSGRNSACADRADRFPGIRYFSNPNVNHPTKGVPLGIDHAVDPDNSANNARVLREVTRSIVSRWRDNGLSGLTFSYNGAYPTSTKMTVDGVDGDMHLKGGAAIGSAFSGLRFSLNGSGMASLDQNGNFLASGYLESQSSHPINSLRIADGSSQIMESLGTDGKIRTKSLVNIGSIP